MLHFIDLTHTIRPGMPLFPGTPEPALTEAGSLEAQGYRETDLHFFSHVGTHMDAPAHVLPSGLFLDQLDIQRFGGRAILVDCREASGWISLSWLKSAPVELQAGDYLLLYTGWSHCWDTPAYYDGFPLLTPEAIDFLAYKQVRGIGLDALSVDGLADESLPNHKRLLGAGILIIENLTNLDNLPAHIPFIFAALPLKYGNADGAPVRAVAFWEE